MNVIVVTDSRGRGLLDFILNKRQDLYNKCNLVIICIPGAGIDRLHRKINEHISDKVENYIPILIGGICDFTQKNKDGILHYEVEDSVPKVLASLNTYWSHYPHGLTATIPPADINKWNSKKQSHVVDPNLEAQKNLEGDIKIVNQEIQERNDREGLPHINLHKPVYVNSIKKKGNRSIRVSKFKSTELPDGVHASENLKEKWFNHICNIIASKTDLH